MSGINRQLTITVLDPGLAPLDLRQRLDEVSPSTSHKRQFTTSLDEAPKQLELAFEVTPANSRANVVATSMQGAVWDQRLDSGGGACSERPTGGTAGKGLKRPPRRD